MSKLTESTTERREGEGERDRRDSADTGARKCERKERDDATASGTGELSQSVWDDLFIFQAHSQEHPQKHLTNWLFFPLPENIRHGNHNGRTIC